MFKFYTKGDEASIEGAVFLNGQRVVSFYANVYPDGEIVVIVEDGSGQQQAEWSDFEESD